MSSLAGVLPVDKPVGPTSHDVVATARRALRERRIGHTGTLDPFASGLLLLCLGPATRLAEYLTGLPKRYVATIRLGVVTDTDDLQGQTLASDEGWREVTPESFEAALASQRGEILQTPPRYSAKKVDGRRMYEVAREGGEVAARAVPVTVHRLEVLRFDLPTVEVEVECSSGTYIRAIARDVGDRLGVGAHLTALRRTRIGRFEVGDALTLDALASEAAVQRALLPPAAAVADLQRLTVPDDEVARLRNGGSVPADESLRGQAPVALVSTAGDLLAIGELRGDRVQPRKVFA